ncbi:MULTISPECIES: hypothetical protein [unclassified Streptomyces]|uniref:hypothetical protein n=1 Tax=unclassified Streptomyces TaxID=2593676 RepID=UPI0036E9DC70
MAIFSRLIPTSRRHDMRDMSRRFDDHGRDRRHGRDHFHDHGDGDHHRDHRW